MSSFDPHSAPGRSVSILLAAAAHRWPALHGELARAGHRVERCEGPEAAVERALAADLDLLLLDAAAGGIGAVAAADILRRLGRTLRIVALGGDVAPGASSLPFDECLVDRDVADPAALDAMLHRARAAGDAAGAADAAFVAEQEAAMAEAVRALAGAFEATLPDLLAAVEAAVSRGDAGALRGPCHRLRGSAPQFGREALGALAGRAEVALHAGRGDEALSIARELRDHLRADLPRPPMDTPR
jgi:HPt (histidine-containing phosphotransfer) domain-containing protein